MIHAGLDVGSTTAKAVALNDQGDILFQTYRRHYSDIKKSYIRNHAGYAKKNVA